MTTEMKQLLALLLLGCVFAVHGAENGAEKMDPCTHGVAAMGLFLKFRGCGDVDPSERLESLLASIAGNFTIHNLKTLFTIICSTMFPRMKECFQRNVQNCSDAQRDSLTQVVEQTGFVCAPNSSTINPVIDHLLAKLTDSDMALNETCNGQNVSMVVSVCNNQSLEAFGANTDVYNGLSMEQLAPKIQNYTRTMIECVVDQYRDRLSSCSSWRGKAIWAIRLLILPPLLGKSMPFTTADLDRLFQWQSGAQSQVNVGQDVLLNLFK